MVVFDTESRILVTIALESPEGNLILRTDTGATDQLLVAESPAIRNFRYYVNLSGGQPLLFFDSNHTLVGLERGLPRRRASSQELTEPQANVRRGSIKLSGVGGAYRPTRERRRPNGTLLSGWEIDLEVPVVWNEERTLLKIMFDPSADEETPVALSRDTWAYVSGDHLSGLLVRVVSKGRIRQMAG